MVDRPFWDNAFFDIQLERDKVGRFGVYGNRCLTYDPFPVEAKDKEELLDWASRADIKFQANLVRGVLGDLIPELKDMPDKEILEFINEIGFDPDSLNN